MRRKTGILCMGIGAVLVLAALLLLLHNIRENEAAGRATDDVLPKMQAAITCPQEPPQHINPYDAQQAAEAREMTVAEIDGYGYIGCLSIPVLELELPVMSEWSYPGLQIAPCRQFGSTWGKDLVIAGHNYDRHFGRLSTLKTDDLLQFTDMDGQLSVYLVGEVGVIPPDSTDEVKNSSWDLILYTCTYGGRSRVMVGCRQLTEQQLEAII